MRGLSQKSTFTLVDAGCTQRKPGSLSDSPLTRHSSGTRLI